MFWNKKKKEEPKDKKQTAIEIMQGSGRYKSINWNGDTLILHRNDSEVLTINVKKCQFEKGNFGETRVSGQFTVTYEGQPMQAKYRYVHAQEGRGQELMFLLSDLSRPKWI